MRHWLRDGRRVPRLRVVLHRAKQRGLRVEIAVRQQGASRLVGADDAVRAVARANAAILEELRVYGRASLMDSTLLECVARCRNLSVLWLLKCDGVTDDGARALAR